MTVLKFSAKWCGPCRSLAPIFHEVQEEYKDKVNFKEVDVDEDPEKLVFKYSISSVPTLIFLDDSENILETLYGGIPKNKLVETIQKYAGN